MEIIGSNFPIKLFEPIKKHNQFLPPNDRVLFDATAEIMFGIYVDDTILPTFKQGPSNVCSEEYKHLYRYHPKLFDIHKWCENTLGFQGCDWDAFYYMALFVTTPIYGKYERMVYVRVQFLEPKNATLFKLRWQ